MERTKNPAALNFLSKATGQEKQQEERQEQKPRPNPEEVREQRQAPAREEEIYVIPEKKTKSRRISVLMYPDLHDDLKIIAQMRGTTFNDLLNEMGENYKNKHQKLIEGYKKLKDKD